KVYIGRMSGGFFNGVTIDSVEIRDDEDSVFFASGPITVAYDPRDLFDRRILLSFLQAEHPYVHLRQHENGDWNWRRIFPASVEKEKRNERGFGQGIVVWGSDLPVRYYVHIIGDSVSLADVAWVYPTLPTTGGGKMELDIRSERNPKYLDYVLTKMDVRTTRSRLLGQMTFATGG